jgi:hypothetical protein
LVVKAEEEGEESPGSSQSSSVDNEDEEGLSLSAFRKAREKKEPEPEFDGLFGLVRRPKQWCVDEFAEGSGGTPSWMSLPPSLSPISH